MDKNTEFYVQPPIIILTAAHCQKKEPGYYLVLEWKMLNMITQGQKETDNINPLVTISSSIADISFVTGGILEHE